MHVASSKDQKKIQLHSDDHIVECSRESTVIPPIEIFIFEAYEKGDSIRPQIQTSAQNKW